MPDLFPVDESMEFISVLWWSVLHVSGAPDGQRFGRLFLQQIQILLPVARTGCNLLSFPAPFGHSLTCPAPSVVVHSDDLLKVGNQRQLIKIEPRNCKKARCREMNESRKSKKNQFVRCLHSTRSHLLRLLKPLTFYFSHFFRNF